MLANNRIPEVLRQLLCLHHCDERTGGHRWLLKTQRSRFFFLPLLFCIRLLLFFIFGIVFFCSQIFFSKLD